MWYQFFLQNLRFSVFAFGALVMMATGWLYLDSTTDQRKFRDWLRIIGFGLWSVALATESLRVEGVSWSLFNFSGMNGMEIFLVNVKILAGLMVFISFLLDPLIPKPKLYIFGLIIGGFQVEYFVAIVWAMVAWSYIRRASVGLERHLYKPAIGIGLIAISEMLSWGKMFGENASVEVVKLVSPFGPIWCTQVLVMFLGILVLANWVFGYLLRRFETQLVLVISVLILCVYLVTTMSFTGLLLFRLRSRSIEQLFNQAKLLEIAMETKQKEMLSDAKWLAGSQDVGVGLSEINKNSLFEYVFSFLENQKMSGILITDKSGKVVVRGEDRNQVGDNLLSNQLVKDALSGKSSGSMELTEGGLVNKVRLIASAPVKAASESSGAVLVYTDLDASYIDGLRKTVGSEIVVYAGDMLSASSLTTSMNQLPLINIKLTNKSVLDKVLLSGSDYSGQIDIAGKVYLAGIEPLKSSDGQVIGMIGVVEPEVSVVMEMARITLATFGVAILLLVISEIPAIIIARNISKQLK